MKDSSLLLPEQCKITWIEGLWTAIYLFKYKLNIYNVQIYLCLFVYTHIECNYYEIKTIASLENNFLCPWSHLIHHHCTHVCENIHTYTPLQFALQSRLNINCLNFENFTGKNVQISLQL